MELNGKKSIVFGGTSGIGLATVKLLAELGSNVVAASRDPSKLTEELENTKIEKINVLDENGMKEFFLKHKPYDILISAATGGTRALGPFLDMDMKGYKNSFDKLWGYANVIRYGTEFLEKNGSIVLVSGAPARKTKPGQVSLGSVGGAVEALVRAVAPEIAPKRINVVSPGTIDTPMIPHKGEDRINFFKDITAENLIPRAGTSMEVAQAIIFMAKNEFVTGTTIDVDGGWLLS